MSMKELLRRQQQDEAQKPAAKVSRELLEEEPLHRTTVTMPASDRELLENLLSRARKAGAADASFSSLVRAGLHALDRADRVDPDAFRAALERAPRLRAGRKKSA